MAAGGRLYGGKSGADRKTDRRERLLRAAITLYARLGREGATVTVICAEAGLTTRYFYESFASHDALFLAVFRGACGHLIEDVRRVRDAGGDPLVAFFAALADHGALARLFIADVDRQDPGVGAAATQLRADLLALLLPAPVDAFSAAGALGALFRIARTWVEQDCVERAEVVAQTARRFIHAAE